jgi:HIRAN domain
MEQPGRNLFVAKQFSDRSIQPVGRLSMIQSPVGIRYRFEYLLAAREIEEFSPFLSFPDFEAVYESDELFPFFQNRVMGRNRPEFSEFVASLNLDERADPFEILERSGGPRETDNIEVFPEPEFDPTSGVATCRFFVRGLRYSEGAFESAGELSAGQSLMLEPDPKNPADPLAVLVQTTEGVRIGWVPRYLTRYVHEALKECDASTIRLSVGRVGDAAYGAHTRLMVQLSCCWIKLPWPFAVESFSPIVEVASA